MSLGFERSANEPTLYKKMQGTSSILLLYIYVDDIIYMSSSLNMMLEFKDRMLKALDMSDLGPLQYFLGLEVKQGKGFVFVSQKRYVEIFLSKSGMIKCKLVTSSLNANEKLCLEHGSGDADAGRYRRLVGSLLYLTHTRPDLMHAVSIVSRYMHQPSQHQLGTVKRIMQYVAGTTNYVFVYEHTYRWQLIGYTDSDWSGSLDD